MAALRVSSCVAVAVAVTVVVAVAADVAVVDIAAVAAVVDKTPYCTGSEYGSDPVYPVRSSVRQCNCWPNRASCCRC